MNIMDWISFLVSFSVKILNLILVSTVLMFHINTYEYNGLDQLFGELFSTCVSRQYLELNLVKIQTFFHQPIMISR